MKKIVLLGVVAVLLTFGLVLVSCGAGCPGNSSCTYKAGQMDVTNYCAFKVDSSWTTKQAEKSADCGKGYIKAIENQKSYSCEC